MQTNRTDFEAGFASLGLATQPKADYVNAETLCRQFKRYTVLTDVNVSYSSSSSSSTMLKHPPKK
jgi:hypothetical protein